MCISILRPATTAATFITRSAVLDQQTPSAAGLLAQMVGRVRIPVARARSADAHPADRVRRDIRAALHAVPLRRRKPLVLIFPCVYAMTGGLLAAIVAGLQLQRRGWVGYIALFGIAVETGVVMVIYLHEALDRRLAAGTVDRRRDRRRRDRRRGAAPAAEVDDGRGGDAEPCADPVGNWNRCRM